MRHYRKYLEGNWDKIMDDQTKLLIGSMIASNLPTLIIIGKYILKKEKELTKIETLLNIAIKDIDGIASFIGTPRAIARKESALKDAEKNSDVQ